MDFDLTEVRMATGRGGAGESLPSPPRSPNSHPRPGPETLIGGETFPAPDPVGSPNIDGSPRGSITQQLNRKIEVQNN